MATWFSGDQDAIRERMSIMAHLMDGDGYTRDTESHGRRGYTGDFRFNFLGASTPLPPRAWDVMGHTGNRFLFIEKRDTEDLDEVIDNVLDESDYGTKVLQCQKGVTDLLRGLWQGHGGYAKVNWNSGITAELKKLFRYLTRLVKHARAPIDESGCPHHEDGYRIATALGNVAKGHAVLHRRDYIEVDDLGVCARIALSTMPKERRDLVREIVSRSPSETMTASDVERVLGVSRPTARDRMNLMDTLGIAECYEKGKKDTKTLRVKPAFVWPDVLDFPEF